MKNDADALDEAIMLLFGVLTSGGASYDLRMDIQRFLGREMRRPILLHDPDGGTLSITAQLDDPTPGDAR